MEPAPKVVFALEAERAVNLMDEWWRENRASAPDLFQRELAAALERIGAMPCYNPIDR